jgi:hypothetical protein
MNTKLGFDASLVQDSDICHQRKMCDAKIPENFVAGNPGRHFEEVRGGHWHGD